MEIKNCNKAGKGAGNWCWQGEAHRLHSEKKQRGWTRSRSEGRALRQGRETAGQGTGINVFHFRDLRIKSC